MKRRRLQRSSSRRELKQIFSLLRLHLLHWTSSRSWVKKRHRGTITTSSRSSRRRLTTTRSQWRPRRRSFHSFQRTSSASTTKATSTHPTQSAGARRQRQRARMLLLKERAVTTIGLSPFTSIWSPICLNSKKLRRNMHLTFCTITSTTKKGFHRKTKNKLYFYY